MTDLEHIRAMFDRVEVEYTYSWTPKKTEHALCVTQHAIGYQNYTSDRHLVLLFDTDGKLKKVRLS